MMNFAEQPETAEGGVEIPAVNRDKYGNSANDAFEAACLGIAYTPTPSPEIAEQPMGEARIETCPSCEGSGVGVVSATCWTCDGLGSSTTPKPADPTSCERCQGNGEIVTDWDRYMHARDGDVGDEAVAPCPDCDGEGEVPADPTSVEGEPDGWLAVKVNSEGGIVMPYGPLHPHPDRPNGPRYRWAPFYLGKPK